MVQLTGNDLTIEMVVDVAVHLQQVEMLADDVRGRVQAAHDWVQEQMTSHGETMIYGVNTGFGPLATTKIEHSQARKLSRNLILNCMAGVGPPLPEDVVRAMLLIRANSLAKGHSGVRPVIIETLIHMLNRGVTPYVPSKGSLGASGDLAPLAHMSVVLTCETHPGDNSESGRAWFGGELLSGAEAMRRAGIPRIVLEAKEGLALSNGTTFMAAAAALAVSRAENLLAHAELGAAMSFEALLGISAALSSDLHRANEQPGQMTTAANLLTLFEGSDLVDSALTKVQDAYSLRCTPQVLGPIRDALSFLRGRVTSALNAASDNPLIFLHDDGTSRAISGGNFHGAGLAMWLDFLRIAIAEAGNLAERRIFRMVTPELSGGLPPMLVSTSGLDSGLMIPQYTAAALVSDNKTLCHPDSVDSIPSSANQEDHVSMGANAARHTLEVLDNVRYILAVELLTAAQAIDLRENGPARLGQMTGIAYRRIRQTVQFLEHDRETASDIAELANLIHTRELLADLDNHEGNTK
jgi:histidine ammonia-lyase